MKILFEMQTQQQMQINENDTKLLFDKIDIDKVKKNFKRLGVNDTMIIEPKDINDTMIIEPKDNNGLLPTFISPEEFRKLIEEIKKVDLGDPEKLLQNPKKNKKKNPDDEIGPDPDQIKPVPMPTYKLPEGADQIKPAPMPTYKSSGSLKELIGAIEVTDLNLGVHDSIGSTKLPTSSLTFSGEMQVNNGKGVS